MPTSEEVLDSPAPPGRPVVRALGGLAVAGLLASAGYAVLTDDSGTPAAAPPISPAAIGPTETPGASRGAIREVDEGPPLFVRYPNPLEGSWTADTGRLTLVIANTRLTLTDVTHYRSLRFIRVDGHRVHVQPSGVDAEIATYRWHIRGDRLTFRLLERTPDATLRLETLTFRRRA